MLQQTVVATVIPYYHAFLREFPDIETLAQSDEQSVLKRWAGLGYYRRAKQLHAAAKQMVAKHESSFPRNFPDIQNLPGVGRYTAGAIASFAFDQRRPIVEANTQRLYARLLRLKGQLSDRSIQSKLWTFAESFLPSRSGSGQVNQAMMELGSQICLPRNPKCHECPLRDICPTHHFGEQDLIPSPKPPKIYEERIEAAVVVHDRRHGYLLRQCQPGERWAGLWDFPRFDITDQASEQEVRCAIEEQFLLRFDQSLNLLSESASIKHGVTRFKITLRCFHGQLRPKTGSRKTSPYSAWYSPKELADLPLSSTGKRIASWLTTSS